MRPEHRFEIARRHRLVIIGTVPTGRGVSNTANIFGQLIDHIVGHVHGFARQDVFEQVREAGAAGRIVLGADLVPERDRNVGRRGIAERINCEAVPELAHFISERRNAQPRRCAFALSNRGGCGPCRQSDRRSGGQQTQFRDHPRSLTSSSFSKRVGVYCVMG